MFNKYIKHSKRKVALYVQNRGHENENFPNFNPSEISYMQSLVSFSNF